MLLPLANTFMLVLMAVLAVIRDRVSDKQAVWVDTLHLIILGAALLLGLVILIVLSTLTSSGSNAVVCNLLIPCITSTP